MVVQQPVWAPVLPLPCIGNAGCSASMFVTGQHPRVLTDVFVCWRGACVFGTGGKLLRCILESSHPYPDCVAALRLSRSFALGW